MLIYGFRALSKYIKELNKIDVERIMKSDYDLIVSINEFNDLLESFGNDVLEIKPFGNDGFYIKTLKGNYDIHIVNKENSNKMLYDNKDNFISKFICIDLYGNKFEVLSLETLFEIKKSHRMILKGFNKTMNDYYRILNLLNNKEVEETEFYKLRLKETLIRAKKQTNHINLKQSKDDFFKTKNVEYIYDHDSIHESVKLTQEPMYKKILVSNEEVMCSEELWNKLSDLEKKYCVLEECYTISIERFLSKNKLSDPYKAFLIALEKVCTTLTKGWFREYAYSNYKEIINMYNESFWNKFQNDLNIGLIKPFVRSQY